MSAIIDALTAAGVLTLCLLLLPLSGWWFAARFRGDALERFTAACLAGVAVLAAIEIIGYALGLPQWCAFSLLALTCAFSARDLAAAVRSREFAWKGLLAWTGTAAILTAASLRYAEPMAFVSIFRSRSLTVANLMMFLIGGTFFAMWYFLTYYFQGVLGYGPVKAGFAFFPMALAIIIGAQISSRLLSKTGVRPLLQIGAVLGTLGFLWISLIKPADSYAGHILVPSFLCAFAMGLLFAPLATAATAGVDRANAGLASGILNTARQVGGSLSPAICHGRDRRVQARPGVGLSGVGLHVRVRPRVPNLRVRDRDRLDVRRATTRGRGE